MLGGTLWSIGMALAGIDWGGTTLALSSAVGERARVGESVFTLDLARATLSLWWREIASVDHFDVTAGGLPCYGEIIFLGCFFV